MRPLMISALRALGPSVASTPLPEAVRAGTFIFHRVEAITDSSCAGSSDKPLGLTPEISLQEVPVGGRLLR